MDVYCLAQCPVTQRQVPAPLALLFLLYRAEGLQAEAEQSLSALILSMSQTIGGFV